MSGGAKGLKRLERMWPLDDVEGSGDIRQVGMNNVGSKGYIRSILIFIKRVSSPLTFHSFLQPEYIPPSTRIPLPHYSLKRRATQNFASPIDNLIADMTKTAEGSMPSTLNPGMFESSYQDVCRFHERKARDAFDQASKPNPNLALSDEERSSLYGYLRRTVPSGRGTHLTELPGPDDPRSGVAALLWREAHSIAMYTRPQKAVDQLSFWDRFSVRASILKHKSSSTPTKSWMDPSTFRGSESHQEDMRAYALRNTQQSIRKAM